jgi:hypothetical protein
MMMQGIAHPELQMKQQSTTPSFLVLIKQRVLLPIAELALEKTTMPAQHLPSQSTHLKAKNFLYNDVLKVAAWAAAVATAGPPEVMDKAVVWLDNEPAQKPIKVWNW